MSEEAKKINDFSIWNSIVNDRIIQFEELERKYNSRGLQIQQLVDEKGAISEQISVLSSQIDVLKSELNKKEDLINKLENENKNLKVYISNMENSTSWKITRPIREVLDIFKR